MKRNTLPPSDSERNTPRAMLTLRVSQAGIDAIATAAAQSGVTRSDMLRAMLAYATDHLPDVQRRLRTR